MKNFLKFKPDINSHFIYEVGTPQSEAPIDTPTAEVAGADESLVNLLSRYSEDPETDKQAIEEAAAFFADKNVTAELIEAAITEMADGSEGENKLSVEDLGRLRELLTSDQQRLQDILNRQDQVEGTPLTEEEQTQLATLQNEGLLEMEESQRLRFVSESNISAEQLASGEVSEMTFDFDQEGNPDLYMNTTAGQVLPPNVRQVVASGPRQDGTTVFTRRGYNGEFFSPNGARLKIHDGTKIKVAEGTDGFVDNDGLEALRQPYLDEAQAALESAELTEDSENFDRFKGVAEMAALKGVDVNLALLIAREGTFKDEEDPDKFSAKMESALTDGHRILDGANPDQVESEEGQLSLQHAADWIRQYIPISQTAKEGLEALGYEADDIDAAFSRPANGGAMNAQLTAEGIQEVVPAKHEALRTAINTIMPHKARYQAIAGRLNISWEAIAAIHYREASCDFNKYFLNGDPLGRPTVRVPAGIMCNTWEESVEHAVNQRNYGFRSLGQDPDPLAVANLAENYNGHGYRNKGLVSPYVWAGHPSYEDQGGMYVRDGQFDRSARDSRVGVMPIFFELKRQ